MQGDLSRRRDGVRECVRDEILLEQRLELGLLERRPPGRDDVLEKGTLERREMSSDHEGAGREGGGVTRPVVRGQEAYGVERGGEEGLQSLEIWDGRLQTADGVSNLRRCDFGTHPRAISSSLEYSVKLCQQNSTASLHGYQSLIKMTMGMVGRGMDCP